MTHVLKKNSALLAVLLAAFLAATLLLNACTPFLSTSTPVLQTRLPGCEVPNGVGQPAAAIDLWLADLGLSSVHGLAYSAEAEAGTILAQSPAAGTRLNPCQGEVLLTISQGPHPTPTPVPSPTPNRPLPTFLPQAYDLLFSESFGERDATGLSLRDWRGIKLGEGDQTRSDRGILTVRGAFEAYAGDITWKNDLRVLLKGGTYGIGLKEFSVFLNRQDEKNYLRLGCADQVQKETGWALVCEWFEAQEGREVRLPLPATPVCSGTCDLELAQDGDLYRLYANDTLIQHFYHSRFTDGEIGLRIQAPQLTPFQLSRLVVYQAPGTGQTHGHTLLLEEFGDSWGNAINNSTEKWDHTLNPAQKMLQLFYKTKPATFNGYSDLVASPDMLGLHLPKRFEYSVTYRLTYAQADLQTGLAYHYDPKTYRYNYFLLGPNGAMYMGAFANYQVKDLLSGYLATGWKRGAYNTVTVQVDEEQTVYLVNGKVQRTLKSSGAEGGTIGFRVILPRPSEQAKIDLANIELRAR